MRIIEVTEASQQRLGPNGTRALVKMFNQAGREPHGEVILLAKERFARRLAEELRGMEGRIERRLGEIRQEISALERKLTRAVSALERKLTESTAALSTEFTERIAAAETRLLRWSFAFWATLLVAFFLK